MQDNVLVVVLAYNQPDFLGPQHACLKQFMKEPFEFVVYNNADSMEMSRKIEAACSNLSIECIRVPQEIHKNRNNPSNRCAKSLQFAYDTRLVSHRPYAMVIDSDMFPIRSFSVQDYLQGFDMAGIYQVRGHVHYITNQLIFFNMQKLIHPWEIKWDCGEVDRIGTDVGGHFYYYHRQYPYLELKRIQHNASETIERSQIDEMIECKHLRNYLHGDYGTKPFSELFADQTFLHLRAGSNWCEMNPMDHNKRITNLYKFLAEISKTPTIQRQIETTMNIGGKRVLSFSLYNDNPKYYIGALCNCLLAPIIYPGWICRFYIDDTISSEMHNVLKSFKHVELVEMTRHRGSEAMFWRFLPSIDDTVAVMLSRDADSWLTWREAAAVNEWLTKYPDKKFHILRDHCYHSFPIMGGMWGVQSGTIAKTIKHKMTMFARKDSFDQRFLADNIMPNVKNTMLIHSTPQWNFQHQFLPKGYYQESYLPIPQIPNEIDEPIPGLSYSQVYCNNEFECCHCNQVHKQFIGAILEKIPQKTLDALAQYLTSHGLSKSILGCK
jgi:hypothetical protein